LPARLSHNILTLAAGDAIVFGRGIVLTACTSTSDTGTIRFSAGGVLGGLLTLGTGAAEMALGNVFTFGETDFEDTVGDGAYSASADTLDMIVGTSAILTGRILLVVGIMNVTNLLTNG